MKKDETPSIEKGKAKEVELNFVYVSCITSSFAQVLQIKVVVVAAIFFL